ncbi:MAG: hypothetical protein ABJE66_37605 [Deltaproteobacteria bacterium]
MLLRIVTLVLILGAQARADVAFALQPALGVGTAIDPVNTSAASTASSSIPRESFRMVPALRLGIDVGSLMILGYGSNSNAGVQGHQVSGFTRAGLVVEPVLWRSEDERVGLYLIGGGGIVALAGTTVALDAMRSTSFTATGATFLVGVGGWYAVHPNFALGLELAVQPDLVSVDSGTYVGDQAVVSVTGTFVAAERSFQH